MTMVFDPALLRVLASSRLPANRAQQLNEHEISVPALVAQLEGLFSSALELSVNRRRAFMQLSDHIEGISSERSQINFKLGYQSPDDRYIALVEQCSMTHAYVATVTIAMIEKAKQARGILQSADFFWTRSADPAFWLMVNGYGRPRHLPGIVGAFTHHAAEKKFEKPIAETFFDIATVKVGEASVLLPDQERLRAFLDARVSF